MTTTGPITKSLDFTHMYDFTDLRGALPLKSMNQDSLLWYINNIKEISDFSDIINIAKMDKKLDGLYNSYTIFAGKNDTFALDKSLQKGAASQIIQTNMMDRRIPIELLKNSYSAEYPTLHQISKIYTNIKDEQITLNGKVKIIEQIVCKNGILYITDGLLTPDVYM